MTKCMKCGQFLETRLGYCFDCATAGEVAAAKCTETGDYAPGGYFDKQGIEWRAEPGTIRVI